MANDKLKAIATKHGVAEDQISAILSALSIKTENPNEVQLKGFERVCELMKGGTPLEKAAQTVADEAKAKATPKDSSGTAPSIAVVECEAQLKEIALRYSLSDRIPEIMTALRLKPESITTEQFEQVRVVCEQVRQGMDLQMVAQAQLDGAKAAKAKPTMPKFAPQPEPAGAIAPTKDRPMPGLVVHDESDIDEFVSELGIREQVELIATDEAKRNVPIIADAPFDGVYRAADRDRDRIAALSHFGGKVYSEKVSEALRDPKVIGDAIARAQARRDARRAEGGQL
jgi:hypothetical protein